VPTDRSLTDRVASHPTVPPALMDYVQGPVVFASAVLLLLVVRVYSALGGWEPGQALALSLGMTASMLLCGGFVYAMSRRASICLAVGDRRAARSFLRRTMMIAGVWVAVVAVVIVVVASASGASTPEQRLTFGLAFVGLSAIWILASGLSLLRASGWLAVGLGVGLLAGLAGDRAVARFSDEHLSVGTVVGFAIALGVVFFALQRALSDERSDEHRRRVLLPPGAYLVYEATPYFIFGSLYATLPFLPHLIGWFGALAEGEGRQWAVINLEIGLSVSLPPLLLASGVTERTLRQFWAQAVVAQKSTPGQAPGQFGIALEQFYRWHLRRYLFVLGVLSGVTFGLFRLAVVSGLLRTWVGSDKLELIEGFFQVSLVSYWLMGWGLFNCVFPLTLARPQLATRAVAAAVVVTLLIGLPLSLGVHFTYAGAAMILGSLAYVVVSSRVVHQVFESAHYYYYSSY
jgi:hypothetical protein